MTEGRADKFIKLYKFLNGNMGVEECFEVKKETRTAFIEKNIAVHFPENVRYSAKQRAIEIVEAYVGQDVNALSVLCYAAERGKFDEFAEKLETHWSESPQYVYPEARKIAQIPGAVRAERFFLECYHALGIQPSSN